MADKYSNTIIKGLYNWTFLVIIIIAVILVNVIASLMYARFDVTDDGRYSLGESTVEFLETTNSFKGRINVKIYLSGNLPAEVEDFKKSIEDKLKEFKAYAGDRIEYQFIDPNVGTDEEKRELHDELFDRGNGILPMNVVYQKDGGQHQMMLWPGAILDYGGAGGGSKRQPVQFLPGTKDGRPIPLDRLDQMIKGSTEDLEYILVSALRKVIQEHKQRIGFLQGHGELTFAETQRARAVISPYYSIADVELNDSIHALDGFDGLIIARPRTKFSDKDLYLIDQFVMRGGRLMCFMDKLYLPEDTLSKYGQTPTSRVETGLDKLMFDYGLKLEDKYVMDVRCLKKSVRMEKQSLIPWFFHIMATPADHIIARNLEPVALEYTTEIKLVESEDIVVTPILMSSPNSKTTGMVPMVNYLIPLEYGNEPLAPNPDNKNNMKCLAALAEGHFTSYFKNRIVDEFAKNPESKYLEKSKVEGKVFLVGNGRWLQNRYDSMPSRNNTNTFMYRPKQDVNDLKQDVDLVKAGHQHVFGNQEFIQNLTDFMMGEHSVLDLRSKADGFHGIDPVKRKEEATFLKILNVGLPIILIIGLALLMNFIRRRKFAR